MLLAWLGIRASAPDPEIVRSAEEGDPEAMNYLGYLLLSGSDGVDRDAAAGLIWLIKAASSGDVKAASNLGWLYVEGDLIAQNLEEGAKWLTTAAEKGLPVAQSLLGDLYRDGRGVERDSLKADSLYREAFERGLGDAGYKLYALNEERLKTLSPHEKVEEGIYYYMRGAPSEGVKLFYSAADEGDAAALALLGDAYSRAIGVPYDYDLSLQYFKRAALAGNPSARFIIGELLEIFPDVFKNKGKEGEGEELESDPFYWYEKAAEGGITDADAANRALFEIKGKEASEKD